jgi:hypothetical protein
VRPDGSVRLAPPRVRDLPPRPGLLFPAGVSYRQAVTSDHLAREARKVLPPGATLTDPLPEGKVVGLRGDGRVVIDPAAPLGDDPDSGRVNTPTYSLPGHLDADGLRARAAEQRLRGWALPRGPTMIVGALPRCQVHLPGDGPGGPGRAGEDRDLTPFSLPE